MVGNKSSGRGGWKYDRKVKYIRQRGTTKRYFIQKERNNKKKISPKLTEMFFWESLCEIITILIPVLKPLCCVFFQWTTDERRQKQGD